MRRRLADGDSTVASTGARGAFFFFAELWAALVFLFARLVAFFVGFAVGASPIGASGAGSARARVSSPDTSRPAQTNASPKRPATRVIRLGSRPRPLMSA